MRRRERSGQDAARDTGQEEAQNSIQETASHEPRITT